MYAILKYVSSSWLCKLRPLAQVEGQTYFMWRGGCLEINHAIYCLCCLAVQIAGYDSCWVMSGGRTSSGTDFINISDLSCMSATCSTPLTWGHFAMCRNLSGNLMSTSLQVAGRCNRKGMWRLWWVVALMLKSLSCQGSSGEFVLRDSSSLRKALSSGILSLTPFFVWIIFSFISLFLLLFFSSGRGLYRR